MAINQQYSTGGCGVEQVSWVALIKNVFRQGIESEIRFPGRQEIRQAVTWLHCDRFCPQRPDLTAANHNDIGPRGHAIVGTRIDNAICCLNSGFCAERSGPRQNQKDWYISGNG